MAILEDIKMGSIRMLISGYTLLIIFHHVHYGIASTTKTKRCVKYRVQDARGKWNQTILGIVVNITESNCLVHVQCVRNEQCMAYNIWHGNNTCELLPQILKCGETEMQKGWSFVHLGDCTKDVPWITGRLDMVAGSPCLSWWETLCDSDSTERPVLAWVAQTKVATRHTRWASSQVRKWVSVASSIFMQRGLEGVYCWKSGTEASSRGWNVDGWYTSVHCGGLHKT